MDIKEMMKPCPFCGQKVENVSITGSRYGIEKIEVDCSCGAEIKIEAAELMSSNIGSIRTGKDALGKWNERREDK